MSIAIDSFESLLQAARQQIEPQRVLFVFLQASLPKDFDAAEKDRYEAGEGGSLKPVMCVDKTLDELSTFAELVEESKQMQQEWQIALIACLDGKHGLPPDAEQAERALKNMMQTVMSGGDLSRYVALDRNGEPVEFY